MSEIIPGREDISVNVDVTTGSAFAVGRQSTGGRVALWRAVQTAQDWWLPIPEGEGTKQLVLASPANSEIEYQIDYYDAGGLQEALETGVLKPRGQHRVDLAALSVDTAGIRVTSTGPLVPALWIDSPKGLAVTNASAVEASAWLLPGAGRRPEGGSARLVVLNIGIDDVTVDLVPMQPTLRPRSFDVPAEGVAEQPLSSAGAYRVEASGPVVVLWTSDVNNKGTAAIGIPIPG